MEDLDYDVFLQNKMKTKSNSGFEVSESELNTNLFPFQRFIIKRAILAGKYAIFADCGLGKTIMQLEWAKLVSEKTQLPVLILAPLAVSGQTIKEAVKFGIGCTKYTNQTDKGVYITNYEQLDNVDCSIFGGVVLDECFAPDTKIQIWRKNKLHNVNIKDCLIGDKVVNCTGLDTITSIKKKKVPYAVKIRYNGKEIISSPRHPYFTQRGWVAAKNIQWGDFIISTDKAMRILRNEFHDTQNFTIEDKILREILFSEMANATTRYNSESSQPDSSEETRGEEITMVQNSTSGKGIAKDKGIKSDAKSINKSESISYIETDEAPTFSAWGEWSRDDITTAINEGCIVRRLDSGICYITGQVTKGLPNELQSGLSYLREENCDRSGWDFTSQSEGIRQEKRREADFFRVESFTILEQGHIELDRYRDERGELYFIDLEIERHPSFTINEGLVHNSSILKNFEGSIKKLILESFKNTLYKLACTATPSPNDPMEIGNHSEFLDVMSRNEMLSMYFIHDGGETAKWRLKGHGVKLFYQFISTWAIMLNKPQDIGFDMSGYNLPPLNIVECQIVTPKRDNGQIFNDAIISATNFNAELRLTQKERLDKVVEIINNNKGQNFIIWIKQNVEGEYLKKVLEDSREVKGSDTSEYKEKTLLGFGNNEFRILITKSKIASFGMNYQNCNNHIFASLDFSFESLYQSIRRSYRFGQLNQVNIYLITTDTMENVQKSISQKQKKFEIMKDEMAKAMNANLTNQLTLSNEVDIESETNEFYSIKKGDAFKLIKDLDNDSIDTCIFSPPFSSLYTYSDSVNDLSNVTSHDEFYQHFEFMIPELMRVLKSGRHIGMHLTQLTTGIAKDGYYSIIDFRGEIIRLFQRHGFIFHAEVTIWKNPELAAIRTKNHQLLHGSTKRDSAIVRPGLADYLVVMRKPGVNESPINNDKKGIPFDKWCKIASPVWMDINESDTLQGYRNGRGENDERHITPTQLEVIENYLHMYTNPNDVVFTPFMGIGSEVYQAIKLGRRGVGFELKDTYYEVAKKNIASAVLAKAQLDLFL